MEEIQENTDHKIEAYPIEIRNERRTILPQKDNSNKMTIKCKACGLPFDSTFTSEEFANLPKDQRESGTLHLCPHCGDLSIYLLRDYTEQQ